MSKEIWHRLKANTVFFNDSTSRELNLMERRKYVLTHFSKLTVEIADLALKYLVRGDRSVFKFE